MAFLIQLRSRVMRAELCRSAGAVPGVTGGVGAAERSGGWCGAVYAASRASEHSVVRSVGARWYGITDLRQCPCIQVATSRRSRYSLPIPAHAQQA